MQQLRSEETAPGPEAEGASAMTPAQRRAIYGPDNSIAPKKTSGISEAEAQAKERTIGRESDEYPAAPTTHSSAMRLHSPFDGHEQQKPSTKLKQSEALGSTSCSRMRVARSRPFNVVK